MITEGNAFTNVLTGYDSFHPGRFFNDRLLAPFSVRLDSLVVQYEQENLDALGAPRDYTASVTVTRRGAAPEAQVLKVNQPLSVDGVQVYLLGNGYAPVVHRPGSEGRCRVLAADAVPAPRIRA